MQLKYRMQAVLSTDSIERQPGFKRVEIIFMHFVPACACRTQTGQNIFQCNNNQLKEVPKGKV